MIIIFLLIKYFVITQVHINICHIRFLYVLYFCFNTKKEHIKSVDKEI